LAEVNTRLGVTKVSVQIVVFASPGTNTYRLQTVFNAVRAEVPILNTASLVAMTSPLTGTGAVP